MNQSMVLLPEKPMMARLNDDRVGFFGVQQTDYGLPVQRSEVRRYIARRRLEPGDPAAFARGELVDPVKPIVYYIDPATPTQWRSCIKQGVDDWQKAFEAAGFQERDLRAGRADTRAGSGILLEDARYSVVRYFASPIQNAYGPHVADPRSGEILESHIGWYHNDEPAAQLASDPDRGHQPRAWKTRFDDALMCQLIRFVSSHEVGHTLGLPHNMKASSSYLVDSPPLGQLYQENEHVALDHGLRPLQLRGPAGRYRRDIDARYRSLRYLRHQVGIPADSGRHHTRRGKADPRPVDPGARDRPDVPIRRPEWRGSKRTDGGPGRRRGQGQQLRDGQPEADHAPASHLDRRAGRRLQPVARAVRPGDRPVRPLCGTCDHDRWRCE